MEEKFVLITGATSGIGYSLAKIFAQNGYSEIIISSQKKNLLRTEKKLKKYKKHTEQNIISICQDLTKENAAQEVYDKVKKMKIFVDILVNNAGFGVVGEEVNIARDKEQKMLQINIVTLTQLCGLFLQDMYKRKSGKILNVSSVGAFQPGPYTAAYYASKSFVGNYTRAIRYEAAFHGIQVCGLYPGTTHTDFFRKTGKKTPIWAMSPDKVAKIAYIGLMKNKEIIIPGWVNRLLRVVPTGIKLKGVAFLKK